MRPARAPVKCATYDTDGAAVDSTAYREYIAKPTSHEAEILRENKH